MEIGVVNWLFFALIIVTLLILDLGVFNKKDQIISFKKSLYLSIFYISIASIFGIYIFYQFGAQSGKEYFTGFILEKAMSLDNIFVISIIFTFFKIPAKFQHRVLFWGILGVIILRAIMITIGAALVARFSWILFIFGAALIYTGLKTWQLADQLAKETPKCPKDKLDIKNMFIYRFLSKKMHIYPKIEDNKFFIRKNNIVYITPLFMALVIIEMMDLVFAIDSIPAIFAITQNSYIIYTSNIFAILGLRALFFLLADLVTRFKYLKYSLALILVFIGAKIFIVHYITIPTHIPLIITILLLAGGIIASLNSNRK